MTRNASLTLVALGLFVVAGCQSAGIQNAFRAPGSSLVPPIANPAGPSLKSGGHGAVMPSANQASNEPAGHREAAGQNVAQVGFVDRVGKRLGSRCGGCQSCVSGGECMTGECGACQVPIEYPMMPMARYADPQEYLCNGGDIDPHAMVTTDDRIAGLDPQDAVVHYTTDAGRIHVQESTRACIYSPRFGAVRQVTGAVAGEKAIGLANTYQPLGPTGIGLSQPSLVVGDIDELAHADVSRRVDAMRDRNRGVPLESIVQPRLAEDALQILATLDFTALSNLAESQILVLQQGAVAAETWFVRDAVEVMIQSLTPPVLTRDARVEQFVEYDFPDAGRLEIIKVADRQHAPQGEVVTFAIHVRNVGDSKVNQVEIADSLVARLEYVPESQTSDREADFTTSENASGSMRMSWKLKEPMEVGETAKIEFKCRVR